MYFFLVPRIQAFDSRDALARGRARLGRRLSPCRVARSKEAGGERVSEARLSSRTRLRLRRAFQTQHLRITSHRTPPHRLIDMAKDRKASLSRMFKKKSSASGSSSPSSSSPADAASPSSSLDSTRIVAEPEKMNGASTATPSSSSRLAPARTRSGSLSEKGAAVLRALQRAPEDESPESTPTGALTPHLEVDTKAEAAAELDDGYVPEGQDSTTPRPRIDGELADVSRAGSIVGLSEEQKKQGRLNREGLRRRGEAKEVEKMVGRPGARRGGSGSDSKKSKKSWEIPRKIFHSSIGECMRRAIA